MAEGSSGSENMADSMEITVKTLQRGGFPLRVKRDTTVAQMKEQLQPLSEIPSSRQRLIFKGRVLRDEQTIQDIGLENGNAVHLVERPADAPPAGAAQSNPPNNRPFMPSMPGLGGPPANMQDFGRFLGGVLNSLAGGGATPVAGGPPAARAGSTGAAPAGGHVYTPRESSMHLLVALHTYLNTLETSTQTPPAIPITSLHPRIQEGAPLEYSWLTSAIRTILENVELPEDLRPSLERACQELDSIPPHPPAGTATTTGSAGAPGAATTGSAGAPGAATTGSAGDPAPASSGGAPVQPSQPATFRSVVPLYNYNELIIPAIRRLVQRAHAYTTGPWAQNLENDINYMRDIRLVEGERWPVAHRIRDISGRLHAAAALFTELARATAAASLAVEGNSSVLSFNSAAVLNADGTQPSFPRLLPRSDNSIISDAFIVRGDLDPSQLGAGIPPIPGMFMMPNLGNPAGGGPSPGGTPGPTPTPATGSGTQTPGGPGVPSMGMPDFSQATGATARFGPFVTPTGTAFGGFSIQGDGPLDLGQQLMNMFASGQVMQGPTTTTIAVTAAQFPGEADAGPGGAPAQGQGPTSAPSSTSTTTPASTAPSGGASARFPGGSAGFTGTSQAFTGFPSATAGFSSSSAGFSSSFPGGMPDLSLPDMSLLDDLPGLGSRFSSLGPGATAAELQQYVRSLSSDLPDLERMLNEGEDANADELLQAYQQMLAANILRQQTQEQQQAHPADGAAAPRSATADSQPPRAPADFSELPAMLEGLSPVIQNIVQNVVNSINNSNNNNTGTTPPPASTGTTAADAGNSTMGAGANAGGDAAGADTQGTAGATPDLTRAVTDAVSSGLQTVLSAVSQNVQHIETGLRQMEQRSGQEAELVDIMRQVSDVLANTFPNRPMASRRPPPTSAPSSTEPTSSQPAPTTTPPAPTTAPASGAFPSTNTPSTTTPSSTGTSSTPGAIGATDTTAGAGATPAAPPESTANAAAAAAAATVAAAATRSVPAAEAGTSGSSAAAAGVGAGTLPPRGLGGKAGGLKTSTAKRRPVSAATKGATGSAGAQEVPTAEKESKQQSSGASPATDGMAGGGADWSQLARAANVLRSATGGSVTTAPAAPSPAPTSEAAPDLLSGLQGLASQLSSGGGGAGSGGGLGNLFQMAGRIASDPAMQPMIAHAASELFGGGSGGGGGLGNLLGSLLGGGALGAGASSQARSLNQPAPSYAALTGMDFDEAEHWRSLMEADEAAQASTPGQPTFSEAYLAGAPPRSKSLFKKDADLEQGSQ